MDGILNNKYKVIFRQYSQSHYYWWSLQIVRHAWPCVQNPIQNRIKNTFRLYETLSKFIYGLRILCLWSGSKINGTSISTGWINHENWRKRCSSEFHHKVVTITKHVAGPPCILLSDWLPRQYWHFKSQWNGAFCISRPWESLGNPLLPGNGQMGHVTRKLIDKLATNSNGEGISARRA